jgi:hopanoid biosynthesis associated protein HpnK
MRRLIVNADDFGLHAAVNQGIQAAYSDGIVSSASLMAGGAAFNDAVRIAKQCPELGVGVHLTLVGARPVLQAAEVPSLVEAAGDFYRSYPLFLKRFLSGKIRLAEVERELAAQIQQVRLSGIMPSHLDSHQHLHVFPGIGGIVLDLARRFSIRAIRVPAEPIGFIGATLPAFGRLVGRGGLTVLANLFRQQTAAAGIRTTDNFFGMLAGGQLTETVLLAILQQLPAGDTEVMTHPGLADPSLAGLYPWGYQWDAERQAACAATVRQLIADRQIQLISYREL